MLQRDAALCLFQIQAPTVYLVDPWLSQPFYSVKYPNKTQFGGEKGLFQLIFPDHNPIITTGKNREIGAPLGPLLISMGFYSSFSTA